MLFFKNLTFPVVVQHHSLRSDLTQGLLELFLFRILLSFSSEVSSAFPSGLYFRLTPSTETPESSSHLTSLSFMSPIMEFVPYDFMWIFPLEARNSLSRIPRSSKALTINLWTSYSLYYFWSPQINYCLFSRAAWVLSLFLPSTAQCWKNFKLSHEMPNCDEGIFFWINKENKGCIPYNLSKWRSARNSECLHSLKTQVESCFAPCDDLIGYGGTIWLWTALKQSFWLAYSFLCHVSYFIFVHEIMCMFLLYLNKNNTP